MASLRRVRRDFRKEILQLVSTGDGNVKTLKALARESFGKEVAVDQLMASFCCTEVSNAVSGLRNDGLIETVGKKWKPVQELDGEDVKVISTRRRKRLRGELKAEVRLAHEHGLVEEAVSASKMLDMISQTLPNEEVVTEEATA